MSSSAYNAFLPGQPSLLTMLLFCLMVVTLMAVLLFLTSWLGETKKGVVKLAPYESGISPTGSARFTYPAPFYLVAIFFLIFDVEAAYIFSWAIAFDRLGLRGWLRITFFILILLASLLYLWRKQGLEWGPARPRS